MRRPRRSAPKPARVPVSVRGIPTPLRAAVAVAALAVPSGESVAQTPLGPPDATLAEDFGAIQTVRELADGRVLVADPLARALYVVDLEAGTRSVVGRQGQGPDEYLQPDAVWPLPGDSTLLVDLGNGRLVALGPDLGFGPTMPIATGDPRPGSGSAFTLALPQAVDGRGRLYARGLGMSAGAALPDSAAVLRIERSARSIDTVAVVKLQDRVLNQSGGANDRSVSIENVPLSPEDAWGVAPDGSVVVARQGSARVEWISPSGEVTRGPALPRNPVDIGTAEKQEYLVEEGRSGGGIGVSVAVENGSVTTRFGRGMAGGAGDRDVDDYVWPDQKPMFHAGRIPVDPSGRAWVRRHVEAGAPSTWDVVDRSGARVATYTLEPGTRVAGFGKGHLYAVAFDDFDLSYLRRYPLPR